MNELTIKDIQNKIINLPNRPPVMLAQDAAEVYEVSAKQVNQAVKRNQERFPKPDFCFRLSAEEVEIIRSQNVTKFYAGEQYRPMAFTRMGANMLSAVLKSPVAAARAVQIMRAFSTLEEAATSINSFRDVIGDELYEKFFGAFGNPSQPKPAPVADLLNMVDKLTTIIYRLESGLLEKAIERANGTKPRAEPGEDFLRDHAAAARPAAGAGGPRPVHQTGNRGGGGRMSQQRKIDDQLTMAMGAVVNLKERLDLVLTWMRTMQAELNKQANRRQELRAVK